MVRTLPAVGGTIDGWHVDIANSVTNDSVVARGSSLLDVVGRQPVSPALRCVTVLTVFFFSVYLTVICTRLARTAATLATGKVSQWWARVEALVIEATEALTLVPMLCVLMISARLRAMQLDPARGDPQPWAQWCMYASSGALFLRFCVDIEWRRHQESHGGKTSGIMPAVFRGIYALAAATLYGCCGAIVISTLILEPRAAEGGELSRETPPFAPSMQCVIVLTVAYFTENLVLEAFGETAKVSGAGGPSTAGPGDCAAGPIEQEQGFLDPSAQQFPPMLCVLLVGIALRNVQLHLQPELWACAAMYASTGALAFQAAWIALSTVAAAVGGWRIGLSSKDSLAASCRLAITGCVYFGTTLTLASVLLTEASSSDARPTPVSTAMKCVMLLTLLFFGVHLGLTLATAAAGAAKRWAGVATAGVQRSLAFAPMLCVMMIGVRLRAMQLKVRDPQEWAQYAMYLAAGAVVVQVACSLHPVCGDEGAQGEQGAQQRGGEEEAAQPSSDEAMTALMNRNLALKVSAIIVLTMRYAASAVLYVSLVVLITALFLMESDPVKA